MAKGNENGGESQFGFKDRAKAEESIKILEEQHEMQYRKLTVRGLLGRAKRVLSMTKAEEKIKNIKEAMEVYEKWLEENGGGQSNKNTKTSDSSEKIETVPGLGFKDKETAEKTLKILEGRDPDYQRLAVRGLIGSSKRTLSGTKNEDKINDINEGVRVLEQFLEEFERENRSQKNMAYLSYDIIRKFPKPNADDDKLLSEFVHAYGKKAKGNYKHLRTMYPEKLDDDSAAADNISWDIIRNRELFKIRAAIRENNYRLFKEDDNTAPTAEHLKLIYWAYTPQIDKIKSYIEKSCKAEDDDADDVGSADNDDDKDAENKKKAKKRKAVNSSSSSASASSSEDDDKSNNNSDDDDEEMKSDDEDNKNQDGDGKTPTKKRKTE